MWIACDSLGLTCFELGNMRDGDGRILRSVCWLVMLYAEGDDWMWMRGCCSRIQTSDDCVVVGYVQERSAGGDAHERDGGGKDW